jgi:hypothetical protein
MHFEYRGGTRAPAGQPFIPSVEAVEHSAPYIISRAKLSDPETAKMAYVGRAAYIAYYNAYYDVNVNKDSAVINRNQIVHGSARGRAISVH